MEPSEEGRAVNLLRKRANFRSGAALAEAAGVHPSVINNIIRGKTQRLHTDTRNEIETATEVPLGTLQRIAEGPESAEEVLAHLNSPFADVDYRAGAEGSDAPQDADLELARRTAEQRETMFATVGRSVGRLGLELVEDPSLDPHPDLVVDAGGRRIVVQVCGRLGPDVSEEITDMVGEQARWRADGVDRVIVFAYVDWPEPVVEEIGRFGIEYAGSQKQLEELLTAEGKG